MQGATVVHQVLADQKIVINVLSEAINSNYEAIGAIQANRTLRIVQDIFGICAPAFQVLIGKLAIT